MGKEMSTYKKLILAVKLAATYWFSMGKFPTKEKVAKMVRENKRG